ncbi:MAG: ribonuclease J [Clostridia bacterium]|nr:ribonuclease J [Clostridia bacterium]
MDKKSKASKNDTPATPLRIIPLGGMCEIGKNMTCIEYGNDMIIVDVGMAFAEENMPGVDAVIPDFTYVIENKSKLRGIFLTHGHEDHIGSLPYFLSEIKCPIFGGKLTVELVRHKLSEKAQSMSGISFRACKNGDVVKAGTNFEIEFIRVNHSIADSYALAINTPAGLMIHSGDFKVDYTPINGKPINLQRFGELGKEGVLLFMCESTNIEIPGNSPSERNVGESFQRIFHESKGRVIVATFSSHVHRMQQIITAAEKYGRHVCLSGRSMINTFEVANSLGYIAMNPNTIIDISEIDNYSPNEIVILTTGSQAEPMSALSRIAFASHKTIEIQKGDTVIISAHPIPGNEKPIYRVINELFKRGAHVIYESLADVHVSGHAYRNELELLHSLIKPKYFVPAHGEYRMLYKHKELAKSLGTLDANVFILNNGDVLEVREDKARINGNVPAAAILIDGSSAGEISNRIFSDRRTLADDGCLSVGITLDTRGNLACLPVVNSLGFIYEDEKEEIHKACAARAMSLLGSEKSTKFDTLEQYANSRQFREALRTMLFEKTKRRPAIIVVVSHLMY